jgi:inosine/xanthosine triphosphatase
MRTAPTKKDPSHNILVAVGSTRRPKIAGVERALAALGPHFDPAARFEVCGVDVASGVSHTPLSRGELMLGARRRAEALREMARTAHQPWCYFVGLEGGLDVVSEDDRRLAFLQSWAYVCDDERGAWGQAGGVLLPEALAVEVLDRGRELSAAIDAFAGGRGIRDAQGAWGVLTRNVITREEAFRTAVINAFAPFVNAALYLRTQIH